MPFVANAILNLSNFSFGQQGFEYLISFVLRYLGKVQKKKKKKKKRYFESALLARKVRSKFEKKKKKKKNRVGLGRTML